MYIAIILIFFCNHLIHVKTFKQCCPGDNTITVNKTCMDGSNVTSLPCESSDLRGPTEDPPAILEIDDDYLTIMDLTESGYYLIEPEQYCMTKESKNGSDLALVCRASVNETTAAIVFRYLKVFCAFISILFLVAILIIYLFVPGLRDIEGKCILNMTGPVCFGYIVYFFTPVFSLIEPNPCDVTAFMFFFSLLCCSSWLCVISFHLWRITIRPIFQSKIQWFLIYCCYGYGVPLVLLVTALIQHFTQSTELVGENQCLFAGNIAIWAYFYGPATIMTVICITLQFWAAKKVWIDIDRKDRSPSVVRLRRKCLMYLHLLLILGSIQVLDMVSYTVFITGNSLEHVWSLVDCRNFLVGGIMFFILVVLRNKVLKALAKNGLWCIKFPKKWEKLIDEESEEVESEEAALTRDSTGL